MRRYSTAFLSAAAIVLLIVGGFRAPPTGAAGAACAWQAELSPRTVGQLNVAFPDTAAWYWVLPYLVRPGTTITVAGRFPDARYMSLNTYDAAFSSFTAAGVASSLPDYRIDPDLGSTNPWQRSGPGGSYTVTLTQSPGRGRPNVLPLAPTGEQVGVGYLLYREYLPADGAASVDLPRVRISEDTGTRTLAPCVAHNAPALGSVLNPVGPLAANIPAGRPDAPAFRRVSGVGAFPNVDNAYLAATITPPGDGRVIVVRGRAPTVPATSGPTTWPPVERTDVRYFSLCTNLAVPPGPVVLNAGTDGTVDTGCRTDDHTHLDRAGDYVYVLGAEAQRAQIDTIPGATFVPLSQRYPHTTEMVLLRNMLPADTFPYAIQKIPPDAGPDRGAAIMGRYYPRITTCSIAALRDGAC